MNRKAQLPVTIAREVAIAEKTYRQLLIGEGAMKV
jgi:hypothetical protein